MTYPIVHFEILGPDGPAAVDFYRRLFDWDLQEVPMEGYDTYAYLPEPDAGIGGGIGQLDSKDGEAHGSGLVTIYVEVEDLHATLERAVRAGADVTLAVTEIAGVGAIARFRDPQGNIVGLVRSAMPDQESSRPDR